MRKLVLALLTMLAAGAAFSSAVTDAVLSSVRLRPPVTKGVRLMAAAEDSGCEVVLSFTGEPEVGPIPVTRGTAIEFDFPGDVEMVPLYYVVTEANPAKVTRHAVPADGFYSVTVQSDTRVEIVCRRPIYVDPGNAPATADVSTGYYSNNALGSIQAAIGLALDGAEVRVTGGRSYEPFAVTNRELHVVSSDPLNPAVIDGGGAKRCVTIAEAYSNELECALEVIPATNGLTVVEGFTLANGGASSDGGGVWGGTVVGCRIKDCRATGSGGGLYGAEARNCLVTGCSAGADGAGAARCVLKNCTVTENAMAGGQTAVADAATVYNSIVFGNGSGTQIGSGCSTLATFTSGVVFGEGWHLRRNSAGVNGALQDFVDDEYDLEGLPRRDGVKVTAGCFQTVEEGADAAVGVTVNGTDLAAGGGAGWSYDFATSNLTITTSGAYTLAGAATGVTVRVAADAGIFFDNLVLRVESGAALSVKGGQTLTVSGGTADLSGTADVDGAVVVAGGSVNMNGRTFADAVDVFGRRVRCVEIELGEQSEEVGVSGLEGYDTRGMRTIDGKIWLWLPEGTGRFSVVDGGHPDGVQALYAASRFGAKGEICGSAPTEDVGLCVDGTDVRVLRTERWAYFPVSSNLVLVADGDYALAGSSCGPSVSVAANANVTFDNLRLDAVGSAMSVADGATLTVRGGTADLRGASDVTGGVVIAGGSVVLNGRSIEPEPVNPAGKKVYPVVVDLNVHSVSNVVVTGLADYDVSGIAPVDGRLCLWLPNGEYGFFVNGVGYVATVADAGAEAYMADLVSVDYLRWNDARLEAATTLAHPLTDGVLELGDGWYVVTGAVKTTGIVVNGTAQLILADGASLTSGGASSEHAGVEVSVGNRLTVYGQEQGTGMLTAIGGTQSAGIGGSSTTGTGGSASCGEITINGGTVTAHGGYHGAAIGGGHGGSAGTITINAGRVTASTNDEDKNGGAGIGGGYDGQGGSVTINGGRVRAMSYRIAAAIGCGGNTGADVTVRIAGGTVWATCVNMVEGTRDIGKSHADGSGPVVIEGGSVFTRSSGIGIDEPRGGTGDCVYCLTVDLRNSDSEFETGNAVRLVGLGVDYGVRDVYTINGKLYLWLPSRDYDFLANGVYRCTAKIDGGSASASVEYVGQSVWVEYLEWDRDDLKFYQNAVIALELVNGVTEIGGYKWYVVQGEVTTGRLNVKGTAHLILADKAKLTATDGVRVARGAELNVYAQSDGDDMGKLVATGTDFVAGIGGIDGAYYGEGGGTVMIHGGDVTATGGMGAAGIGGGSVYDYEMGIGGAGCTLTICGGKVSATGGMNAAGIGGGCGPTAGGAGGAATVYGGRVSVTSGSFASGIGGAFGMDTGGDGAEVTIAGGTVKVWGDEFDIGGVREGVSKAVVIDGGSLVADHSTIFCAPTNSSGRAVYPVWLENLDDDGTMVIEGLGAYGVRDIRPVAGRVCLWLPNGEHKFMAGDVMYAATVADGPATAVADGRGKVDYLDWNGSGMERKSVVASVLESDMTEIGSTAGDWYVVTGQVTVTGLRVKGTAHLILADGAKLTVPSTLWVVTGNTLKIYAQSEGANMGALEVTGTSGATGIGGGDYQNGGEIVINGGRLKVKGGANEAGIGGDCKEGGCFVTINGGDVTVTGGYDAAGLGGSARSHGSTVTINGGIVTAKGDIGGTAGIGGGKYGAGGAVTIRGGTLMVTGYGGGADIGPGDGGEPGTLTIAGGNVLLTRGLANPAPTNAAQRAVFSVAVELPASAVAAGIKPVTIQGLADYGLRDVCAVDGKICLWLPNGAYDFRANGVRYTATVADGPVTANRWLDDVGYLAWNGTEMTPSTNGAMILTADVTTLGDGIWYVVTDWMAMSGLAVNGTANLILMDDATLVADGGIRVTEGNALNIFAQSEGARMGELTANGANDGAGIGGGHEEAAGAISIHGGKVTAKGHGCAAGIGGGTFDSVDAARVSGGAVAIYGGVVKATGAFAAAGIGGGRYGAGKSVVIVGGEVTAIGGNEGAGIGGGYKTGGGEITIRGGTVTATAGGGDYGCGAGIGGGSCYGNTACPGGTITISGGTVAATSAGSYGAGIGGGYDGSGGTIVISGGRVTATGGNEGAGIGGGKQNYHGYGTRGGAGGNITISGGTVTATGEDGAKDIGGGGNYAYGGTVKITGGSVIATRSSIGNAPIDGGNKPVFCVTVDVPASSVSSLASFTVEGLAGYGDNDLYPIDGKLYLWLPNGGSYFQVSDGEAKTGYRCQVANDPTVAEPYGPKEAGLTVNGLSVMYGPREGWRFDPGSETLVLDGGIDGYTIGGSNVTATIVASNTVSLTLASSAVGKVAAAPDANLRLAFAGRGCLIADRLRLPDATRGVLEVTGGTAQIVSVEGDDASTLVISGGSLAFDCAPDAVPARDGSGRRLVQATIVVPACCPDDRPVRIEGLGSYGVSEIYPINGRVSLWLPDLGGLVDRMFFTVDGHYYFLPETWGPEEEIVGVWTGFAVNGVDISAASGAGWDYDIHRGTLTFDGSVEYELCCTNGVFDYDVKPTAANGTVTVRGTLDWSDPELAFAGAFEIAGGNIIAATRQFNVAPSNGAEAVCAVRLTLPEDVDPYVPVELGGLPGYDTNGMYAINREVCLWLPNGLHEFTVNGARCTADVRGRDTAAAYCETGVSVDGEDCATVMGVGWSWSPVTKRLLLDGAHVLDSLAGTNLSDRVMVVGSEEGAICGGTSDLPADDVIGSVCIVGGSHRFEGEFAVPPSNGVARVWRVEALVPYGVAEGDEVVVECPGYDGTGVRARDGRVWLWLPDTPSLFFTINGTLYHVAINGENVRAAAHETGLCLNGLDIGGGRGLGWTWDYATGKLVISGRIDSYEFSRSESVDSAVGSYGDANLALVEITNSTAVVLNGTEVFAGAGHAVFTTATGAVTTLRFKQAKNAIVGDRFGDDVKPGVALSGEGEYVIAGGTAEIGRSAGEPSVASRITINGGSVRVGSETDFKYPPVNCESQRVYRVAVPMPRRADRGRALAVKGLPDYYDASEIYPYEGDVAEDAGYVYLWLPTNSYHLTVGGFRFNVDVTGSGWVEASPELSPIGVRVNGVDCSYYGDTGWSWTPVTDTLYLSGECEYLISGTNEAGWVSIAVTNTARATKVLLDDLRIAGLRNGQSAIDVRPGAELVLGLVGDLDGEGPVLDGAPGVYNTGEAGGAGIRVPEGAKLTIGGTFSCATDQHETLIVNGGRLAAGIGGIAGETMGEVTIGDHGVIAHGGDRGAGIGGGSRGSGGVLAVTGGEIVAFGGAGVDGTGLEDDLGGAGIGGGAGGDGGEVKIEGGVVTALGGAGGAVIGGGAGGDGGTLDIRAGTVYPYVADSVTVGASVFGGGSGGEDGVNLFRGGSIAVTNGTIRSAPSNGTQPVTLVAIELPRDLENNPEYRSHFVRVAIEGDLPPGYGTRDIFTYEGHVYLWFPDGNYEFTMGGVAYSVSVADGVVTESHYRATGVTVNGRDVSFAEGPGWTWSPVSGALALTDDRDYVVTGEAERSNVWVSASGSARVIVSNFTAGASIELPLQAASGSPSFRFAGVCERFAAIGGAGKAVVAGGNVVFGSIADQANVVVKGGNVFVEGSFPTNKVTDAEGAAVVPVTLGVPTGCAPDSPISLAGLPPEYDVTGIRAIDGKICVWLPYGTYKVDATGRDDEGMPRSWAKEITVYDFGYYQRFLELVVVKDEEGNDVVIPRQWVDKYKLVGEYASTEDYSNAVVQASENAGLLVWQSYVAGLNPTDPDDAFYAVIEVLPGDWVSVGPNIVRANRLYKIVASKDLKFTDTVIFAVGADGRGVIDMTTGYRFFKVRVGLE